MGVEMFHLEHIDDKGDQFLLSANGDAIGAVFLAGGFAAY